MSAELLQKIIELVLAILGIVITTYVVPYYKSKLSADELSKLKEYITLGVRCAEMYFTTEQGKEKKAFVLEYTKTVLGNLVSSDVTDEQLDVLIEGIVNSVKYGYALEVNNGNNTTTK